MKPKRQEPEGFAQFWDAWRPHARHTDGRGLAREAFAKHVASGADPMDIVDGAKCFLRTMSDRDREFIPLSATWINRGAYEDLCHVERTYRERVEAMRSRPAPAPQAAKQETRVEISPEEQKRRQETVERLLGGAAKGMSVN